ncbi:hypothetical protein C2E21_4657 [Chlorella sorokiniana]|uniref:Uncharacterized protein n=1 Tax=Chlorella sorokiniana TaxID=3076 RepID=A0A2P6TQV3_CHLSO|nr:hypothetical protein C2E21_4657 [Chlorella sorokiniana]|eukprot:PRW56413.1 hypothetical protein C2E21_4657 [Chlorella sorokiniana]
MLGDAAAEQAQHSAAEAANSADEVQALQGGLRSLRLAQQEQERWLRSLPDASQVSASELIQRVQPLLAPAAALAPFLREHWAQSEQVAADRLALARAAAARSCAYLRCANLGGEGGSGGGAGRGQPAVQRLPCGVVLPHRLLPR